MFRYGPLNFTKQSQFEITRLVLGSKVTNMFHYCFLGGSCWIFGSEEIEL